MVNPWPVRTIKPGWSIPILASLCESPTRFVSLAQPMDRRRPVSGRDILGLETRLGRSRAIIVAVPGGMLLRTLLELAVHRIVPFLDGWFVDWSG